ncbi:hypothetical protein [Marinobacterium jannaschii]|uniref:hypothetical protein n=1 Tax=Marinobacterium jannaschii TaxID=64970 RepID=UPI0006859214|nr:hypothetical protein [Marinobacterium jannaschii]
MPLTQTAPSLTLFQLSGWLLMLTLCLSITAGVADSVPAWPAGICAWVSGLLMLSRVRRQQRLQALLMVASGVLGIIYSVLSSGKLQPLLNALTGNQALITMLVSVSFLRLLAADDPATAPPAPVGNATLWRTLLGVHLFGAVINFSAVIIFGDRMAARQPIKPIQLLCLSRGFCMAALWSPFFAAMGVALTNAPGAELSVLALAGLPLAAIALLLAGRELAQQPEADQFSGYPMQRSALWLPLVLAVLMFLGHRYLPQLSVLTLIALIALSLPAAVLSLQRRHSARLCFRRHIQGALPNMGAEVTLFLSAGVLASGIAAVMQVSHFSLQLISFGATEASLLLALGLLLSMVGVHPVITIATAGGVLAPVVDSPNLLGATFLMIWALGVVASAYSGIHLAMSGRFEQNNLDFMRWNSRFALKLLLFLVAALHLYQALEIY